MNPHPNSKGLTRENKRLWLSTLIVPMLKKDRGVIKTN